MIESTDYIMWGLWFAVGFCFASIYWTKRIQEIRCSYELQNETGGKNGNR